MGASDIIARFIKDLLEDDGQAEFGRNELALRFNVVPSQINYVIASRFTPEQGYIVESKRGGGGYIKIYRPDYSNKGYLMHILNSIGEKIDSNTAILFLNNMLESGLIDRNSYLLFISAVSEKNFSGIPSQVKDRLRASIFKNMLLALQI